MGKSNTLKLKIFPHFIKALVDDKTISVHDLCNPELASSILSANIVAKLKAINEHKVVTENDGKFVNTMFLNWVGKYREVTYTNSLKAQPQTFLTALFEDGAEEGANDLCKLLHNYKLSFTSMRVTDKEYAIFLNELEPVSSPTDRKDAMLKSMRGLLNEMSIHLPESTFTKESIYTDYVRLLSGK